MSHPREKDALEFVRTHPTAHMATVEGSTPVTRIMYAAKIDDDFCIWYATGTTSNKVRHIKANPSTCSTFQEGWKWLRTIGKAEIVTDKAGREKIWNDSFSKYWPGGIDDPNLTVLKITPTQVEFFESESSMEAARIR